MIVRTKVIGHYSLLYSLLITHYYSEYKHPVNRTNLRICRRLIRSRFIRTSHVKSQPITSKYFAQEYNFLGPTNTHPLLGLCLRLDNDINEALSP